MTKDIVILYSGGMDSTTALYEYANDIRLAVSFDYGSKHNAKEIEYARKNCELLGIEHRIVNIDFNELGFKSDLLKSGGDIPNGHYEAETMKKTVVPFRNGIMLSIVAGIAESHDCKKLLISNHAGDHAIYPDCRAILFRIHPSQERKDTRIVKGCSCCRLLLCSITDTGATLL